MVVVVILSFLIWLIATEFIFFKYLRGESFPESFLMEKLGSVVAGLIITFFVFVCPLSLSYEYGNIAYLYYYGIIGGVVLFLLINYKIGEWVDYRDANRELIERSRETRQPFLRKRGVQNGNRSRN